MKTGFTALPVPDLPDDFEPKGLSCGFIKVNKKLNTGQILELKDRRQIKVEVVEDIRPDRTAHKPMKQML
jgi:aminomethyltransferase